MNVLVVAVHPDDETLGAGGTILRHSELGDNVTWLIITKSQNEDFQKNRDNEIKSVSDILGVKNILELGLITTTLADLNFSSLVSSISEVIKKVQPEVIYTPFWNDAHTDHQVVAKAINSCSKSFRYPFIKKVLMMETVSETEFSLYNPALNFNPNYFVDISQFIDKKINALKEYKSELGEPPFPRSIENIMALARYRGSSCGVEYAESFMLLKEVVS